MKVISHVRKANKLCAAVMCIYLSLGPIGLSSETNVGGIATGTTPLNMPEILSHFKEQWTANNIEYVLFLHVPSDAVFQVEFTPSRLDSEAFFRLAVRLPRAVGVTQALREQVENLSAKRSDKETYARWGFIFLNKKGDRLLSIYTDASGKSGFVNGSPVEFGSNALFKWAESTFQGVFASSP